MEMEEHRHNRVHPVKGERQPDSPHVAKSTLFSGRHFKEVGNAGVQGSSSAGLSFQSLAMLDSGLSLSDALLDSRRKVQPLLSGNIKATPALPDSLWDS